MTNPNLEDVTQPPILPALVARLRGNQIYGMSSTLKPEEADFICDILDAAVDMVTVDSLKNYNKLKRLVQKLDL